MQTWLQKALSKDQLKDFGLLTLGTLCVSVGVYFFKFPNNFSTGGVSGLAVVLDMFIPNMSAGSLVFVINAILLLIGYLVVGKGFGLRTAYSSTLFSGAVWALEKLLPMSGPMTSQPFMELLFAVGLPAVGSAILFNIGASSGGTDIVAMLLRKYTSLDIGKALMVSDGLITVAACFVFGMETGLFSITGLLIKSLMVDMVLENIKVAKCFQIITAHPEPMKKYIVQQLHRGATVSEAEGAFTGERRAIVLTVVNRSQAVRLRQFAKQTDPHSFILITNTSEIIGKGFRGVN